VGAGDKAAPGTDQHHRLDLGVGVALVERRDDALRHPRRQRVDRRVVDGDDANVAILLETDQLALFGHRTLPTTTHRDSSATAPPEPTRANKSVDATSV